MLWQRVVQALQAQPPIEPIVDPQKVKTLYRYWRRRVMYSLFIGYALFYFTRKNISIALPALSADLGYSNVQLGILGSLLYVTYGIGSFVNGIIADRANPRYFMAVGLFLSALMNIFFGMSSALWTLAVFWGINGYVQAMGFPPCARLLANWYSVSERGFTWSIWHVSHQVGGAVIAILAGYLIQHYGWRSSFYVPAGLCIVTGFFLWNRLRDTPPSMGLPNIALYKNDIELNKDGTEVTDEPETVRYILFHRVLNNHYIWMIGLMNMFLYIVRFGAFDWATKFLVEQKGSEIAKAGIVVSLIEIAGIAGPIMGGYISDKWTKGRRGPICCIGFIFSILGLLIFYFNPPGRPILDGVGLAMIGFWIYIPQFLQGVFAADFASRKAASSAIGLTRIFGYAGASLSGVGTGWFLDHYGWAGGFGFWIGAGTAAALIAGLLWNATPATHKFKNGAIPSAKPDRRV